MPDFSDQVKTPPSQAPGRQPDLVGRTVGRFVIEARLGAGGMGEVYRAVDTRLKRTVAIKRMSERGALTAPDHALFLREGQRASALQHPNIAGIYDVFEQDGEVFLVMEYVEGVTLRSRMGTPVPLDEFFDIAIQCAEALAAAHAKGILHGDVKPENIMLGAQGRVKLLDFGVARRLPRDEPDAPTATVEDFAQGHLMGTPSYMAPEVLKGSDPDVRSDIFALGIVFYEMLAGKHPFKGVTVTVTTAQILDDREAASLDRSKLRIASPVAAVVAGALMKDPAQRYPTTQALIAALETAKRGKQPAPAGRRSPLRWAGWLIAVAALLAGLYFLQRVHHSSQAAKPAAVTLASATPRLAVMPPQVEGTDQKLIAFAEGLSATVTGKLAGLSQDHSLAILDAAHLRKGQTGPAEPELMESGATLALQLSVRESAGMAQASYRLTDLRTGKEVAAQTFTAPASDPFSLQDSVSNGVVRALQIDLRPDEQAALGVHGTTQPAAYDYFLQGKGYLLRTSRSENVGNAVEVLNRAVQVDANYGKAYAARGQAYWDQYQATKQAKWVALAKQDCNHAVSLGNAGADGHLCLGLIAAGTGEYPQAAKEYQHAVELDSTSNEAYVGLASAYARMNRLSDAENAYRQAISQDPNSNWAWEQLGNFLLQQAEYSKAADAFQQAIKLAPESHVLYSNLGVAYLYQGDRTQAIAALMQSIKLRPTAGAFANLGTALYQSRRFAEAAGNYQQALALSSQDPDLWGNLADAYQYSGQTAKAKEAYKKQVELLLPLLQVNPRDAERQGDAASCYAMLGQKQEATEHLAQSLALGRGNKDLLFNAAVVYNDLGETGVALEWLQKALTAGYSPSIIRDSPSFDNLHGNTSFQQLLARMANK